MNEDEFLGLNLPDCRVVAEDDPKAHEVDGMASDDPAAARPENFTNTRYQGVVNEADSPEAVRRLLGMSNQELRGAVRSETDEGPVYRVYFWELRE